MFFGKRAQNFVMALVAAVTAFTPLARASDWDLGDHKLTNCVVPGDASRGFLKPAALLDSTTSARLVLAGPRVLAGRGGVNCDGTG